MVEGRTKVIRLETPNGDATMMTTGTLLLVLLAIALGDFDG